MNTETPPPISNAEAVQILTDGRLLASLTPRQKDAVLRAVHLVSRRSAQEERRERNRRASAEHLRDAKKKVCDSNGNAAAMRDALERIVNLAPDYPAHGVDWNALAAEAFLTASSALAAPARNCDRFATEDEAREAYWAYREPLEFNNKPFVAIVEWLFAPAEGGAK